MKRHIQGWLVVALGLVLASAAVAYDYTNEPLPGSGINDTVHDLSTGANGLGAYVANPDDTLDRICIFCHTPHHSYKLSQANGGPPAGLGSGNQAGDEFTYLPLWNHALTGNAGSYSMYYNGPGAPQVGKKASQAVQQAVSGPGGVSLLCLSCHDGSVAVNEYGNSSQPASSQSSGSGPIGAEYTIGKDNYLGNHHPIGFDYDAVSGADDEIEDADVASYGSAGDVRSHLYEDGNTRMECPTCHSVHNKGNEGERLLWISDNYSNLCLTCHLKGTKQ